MNDAGTEVGWDEELDEDGGGINLGEIVDVAREQFPGVELSEIRLSGQRYFKKLTMHKSHKF